MGRSQHPISPQPLGSPRCLDRTSRIARHQDDTANRAIGDETHRGDRDPGRRLVRVDRRGRRHREHAYNERPQETRQPKLAKPGPDALREPRHLGHQVDSSDRRAAPTGPMRSRPRLVSDTPIRPARASKPRWLPSRLVPHRHGPRAELQPAHELQVDMLRQPREHVGPLRRRTGDAPRTRTHRSIPAPSTPSGSVTPPREQPVARLPLELPNGVAQFPAHQFRVPIDSLERARHDVLLAASIVWAKGSVHSGLAPVAAEGRNADSIIS